MTGVLIGPIVTSLRRWCAAPGALAVIVTLAPIATGCTYRNCDHIVGGHCVDAAPGAGPCTTGDGCASSGEVCDVAGTGQCVQCTPDHAAACTGSTPVCGLDRVCRACAAHAECPLSSACLPDGTCAAESDVAYVDPRGTDNASCSLSMPCTRVAAALATARPYVKFHGRIDEPVTVGQQRSVTFLADPGATLTSTSPSAASQPVLAVQDTGTSLAVYDLTIADASDLSTVGVVIPQASGDPSLTLIRVTIANNPGGGIRVSGGRIQLAQSIVRDNLGGGIMVNSPAAFQIIGNVIIDNGTGDSPLGGIAISTTAATDNQLEFNSLYQNASQDGIGAALRCVAGAFTARNNIYFDNGSATNHEQVSGTCAYTYSIVKPGSLPMGIGNMTADPLFVGASGGNLRVQPASPAIRAADPDSDLTGLAARDLDGTLRARPATLGAYQGAVTSPVEVSLRRRGATVR